MYNSTSRNELLSFLAEPKHRDCQVVVMPDFFLDRIVNLPWNIEAFTEAISEVAARKGGSIDGIHQIDMKGGNSINTASALTRLGITVTPIICTSAYGLQLIKYHFKDAPMDFSHIKTVGKASITTALELRGVNEKVNVMLRDVGGLADFGPHDLTDSDYTLIESADYVCLFNWVGTRNYGTALADAVFNRTKQRGRGKTYYDTADPNPNFQGIPDFIEKVLKTPKVDILSLNENEAITYASIVDPNFKRHKGQREEFAELAMDAARILAKHFQARIDLHTSLFSATLKGTSEVVVPTFKIEVYRATGAGDAWNAGNIHAEHYGLSDECRLMFANAVSACYLSGADGTHPTREKVASFIKSNL
jgi:sugar/nucleoside kinase (ribokinase family)